MYQNQYVWCYLAVCAGSSSVLHTVLPSSTIKTVGKWRAAHRLNIMHLVHWWCIAIPMRIISTPSLSTPNQSSDQKRVLVIRLSLLWFRFTAHMTRKKHPYMQINPYLLHSVTTVTHACYSPCTFRMWLASWTASCPSLTRHVYVLPSLLVSTLRTILSP